MATDAISVTADHPPERDPNCVSCMLEHNQGIDQAIATLGAGYEYLKASLEWRFPKNPQTCAHHRAQQGEPRPETTRLRAVREPTESAPEEAAAATPEGAAPLPPWLAGALPGSPAARRNPYADASLTIFPKTGELPDPPGTPKPVAPRWLNSSEASHPLFGEPQRLPIHQEACACEHGLVYSLDRRTWWTCPDCKGTGWKTPKPKASPVPEPYALMTPPARAERATPMALAEQPQGTGAMPVLPVDKRPGKLPSGEFPTLNAALLRVIRGEAQLSTLYTALRSEVPPYLHQYISDMLTLADNIRLFAEGLPREQQLLWQAVETSLRLSAEYAERGERDLRTLPQEGRHAP